tara:strand:- start:8350 stop:9258 length:909 start_codon:yes stop_codon:yes gene_type:complete
MNIHIRHTIEFEKVKEMKGDIALTRKRMSIQQLLDSRENDGTLIVQLTKYIAEFDKAMELVVRERHLPLESMPLFSWSVDDAIINSPCWYTDAIVSRVALSDLLMSTGIKQLPDYKAAAVTFASAIVQHQQILTQLSAWKWKNPQHNYFFLQPAWHNAAICHLESLRHLAMVSVGIEKNLPNKTLYTVAQRAVNSAAESIAHWPKTELLPLCETLRYYFSANLLWENAQYGASIHTMQTWLTHKLRPSAFDSINTELEKIDFLLEERQRTNEGAYFDAISEPTPLPTPVELLNSKEDIKHPL